VPFAATYSIDDELIDNRTEYLNLRRNGIMKITCPCCGNHRKFLSPVGACYIQIYWRGTISILHVKQLESLEEKLTNQNTYPTWPAWNAALKQKLILMNMRRLTKPASEKWLWRDYEKCYKKLITDKIKMRSTNGLMSWRVNLLIYS